MEEKEEDNGRWTKRRERQGNSEQGEVGICKKQF